jgi:hypothetical protein
MQQFAQIFGYCLLAWLFALAAIIALRMLSGKIPVQGILTTAGGDADPERVQSLLVTAFVIGALITDLPGSVERRSLPEIPQSLLLLLAGSNSLYLGGKIARTQVATSQRKQNRSRRTIRGRGKLRKPPSSGASR